jgi:hypothetical protein
MRISQDHAQIDFSEEYRDARKIAKRWWSICHRDEHRVDNSLKAFLELIRMPMPAYFGQRKATSRLRALIDMLDRRETFAS